MSTEMLVAIGKRQEIVSDKGQVQPWELLPGRAKADSSDTTAVVQKVWCAPMTEAGEWVITWTRVPGALSYEVQTTRDGDQWSSGARFSGTRAVLLLGPAPGCWVRVRAIGPNGPGPWSGPKMSKPARETFLVA
jgi:hypothetical protein